MFFTIMFHYWGYWVLMVYVWMELSLIIIILDPKHFHAYVVNVVELF